CRELKPSRRLRLPCPPRESWEVLIHRISQKLCMRRDVRNIVALVIGGSYRTIEAGGRVTKSRIDEPSLSFTSPHSPSIPHPRVFSLAVPFEVPDVTRLEIDSVPVVRTEDCDSCVRPAHRLSSQEGGKHCTSDQCCACERKTSISHSISAA